MAPAVLANHIYSIICVLCAVYAAIPQSAVQVIPAQWQPYVVGFFGVLMWLKSHWNLFISPQGIQTDKASFTGEK